MLQSDIKTVHIYLQHPDRKTNARFKVAQIIFLDDDSNLFLNSDGFFFLQKNYLRFQVFCLHLQYYLSAVDR